MKLFVAARLPAKAQVSRASAGGKHLSRREAREKKRYAAGEAAGFAVRLLELVDEWEGSGCSLRPGKQHILYTACGGTQWILVRL